MERILQNGYILMVITAIAWSGNAIVARGVHEIVPPIGLSFWRWIVAFVVFLPFGLRPMWEQRALYLRHWKLVLLPAPDGPTMARVSPGSIARLKSSIALSSGREG